MRKHRVTRRLLVESLEPRHLLSGLAPWVPVSGGYPIFDHSEVVAPAPTSLPVQNFRTNFNVKATGTTTVGQFTDNLSTNANIKAQTNIIGKLTAFSANGTSDAQKVDVVGRMGNNPGNTNNISTQTYSHAEFYARGTGVGTFSITVNANAQNEHIWQAEISGEKTTDVSSATTTINVSVAGQFTVSVEATVGNENMAFNLSDASGYDQARTKRGFANISVFVLSSGAYTVTTTGTTKSLIDEYDSYTTPGTMTLQSESNTDGAFNLRSAGTKGGIGISLISERSFITGYANFVRANEMVFKTSCSVSVDNRNGLSCGSITTSANYDKQHDAHSANMPVRGASKINASAMARLAPPDDVEAARQKLWADTWLFENLFLAEEF